MSGIILCGKHGFTVDVTKILFGNDIFKTNKRIADHVTAQVLRLVRYRIVSKRVQEGYGILVERGGRV